MAPATVDSLVDNLSRCHLLISLFAFLRGMPVTWNLMMVVFVTPPNVPYRCSTSSVNWTRTVFSATNASVLEEEARTQCFEDVWNATDAEAVRIPCSSWEYDSSLYGHTVIEEWNLVCQSKWLVSVGQSVYLAGLVVGTVFSSHLSDWFGRKRSLLMGILLTAAASVCAAFSNSVPMYYASRFVVAFGTTGFSDIVYTLVMETVSPRFRFMPTMTLGMGWTTGMVLLPWLAYLTRDWRLTQMYAAAPLALMLLVWCFVPESPRWLLATGKFQEARDVLARFSKHSKAPAQAVDEIIDEAKRKRETARDIGRATIPDLFSTRTWATTTTVFSLQLIVSSMLWYHVTVSTAGVGGSPYVNFSIAACSEYPVKAINVVLIKWCKRRRAIAGSFTLSGIVLLAVFFVPQDYAWTKLCLLIVGKVCTSVNGALFRVQLSETYPTVVRSVAMGFCLTAGRLGSVLAPFFNDLGDATLPWVPNVLAAVLAVISACLVVFLPESFQKVLEDTFTKEEKRKTSGPPEETPNIYSVERSHL